MSTEEKVDIVDNVSYKYSASWINTLETESHWRLYWQQQKLMENIVKPGQKILEIGVGSGFAANYLRSKAVHVTTLDIDKDKKPDIIGNIVSMDWSNLKFDHILAFEVFEHIPYIEFLNLLDKLNTVCNCCLFISLPKYVKVWVDIEYKIPKIGSRKFSLTSKKNKITENHHFWEVGYNTSTKENLKKEFIKKNFQVIDEIEKTGHIFFNLKRIQTT
jgi:2-polyprenyl-3-methyl-5-hydroxy-6-metoxy-1,4-benzoquinol methylase